jgi:hypothetical protein
MRNKLSAFLLLTITAVSLSSCFASRSKYGCPGNQPLRPGSEANQNELCMEWIPLTDEAQLQEIVSKSNTKPQVIFKHSTRCSISSVAMQRLKRGPHRTNLTFITWT